MVKALKQPKRELATKNIRIYESTLESLQNYSFIRGRTIARTVDDALKLAKIFGKWDEPMA